MVTAFSSARLTRPDARDARWVEPMLVAEVEFTTWTRDGRVRHPSFKGLREDKAPKSVTIESPRAIENDTGARHGR
jgi:ATP-dependent DNA ligase